MPLAAGTVAAAAESQVPPGTLSEATLRSSQLYSEELGIDLAANTDAELFKWFLASVLLGARISETIAKRTYRTFERHGLLTPKQILSAGWDHLVNPIMREGGYVRYDGKTSTEILRNCEMLLTEYQGSLRRLHALASDSRDLEARLDRFFGVGPVTINIFLRELRPWWAKADPEPVPGVKAAARKLKIDLGKYSRQGMAFARLEAGMIRHRKELGTWRASTSAKRATRRHRLKTRNPGTA
jgi:hypothetical protein